MPQLVLHATVHVSSVRVQPRVHQRPVVPIVGSIGGRRGRIYFRPVGFGAQLAGSGRLAAGHSGHSGQAGRCGRSSRSRRLTRAAGGVVVVIEGSGAAARLAAVLAALAALASLAGLSSGRALALVDGRTFVRSVGVLLHVFGQVCLLGVGLAAVLANVGLEVLGLLVLGDVLQEGGLVGETLVAAANREKKGRKLVSQDLDHGSHDAGEPEPVALVGLVGLVAA